jgi:hypothetical protein
MAAIIIAVKRRIANERRDKKPDDGVRSNDSDETQDLLDRLPPREFRELDIELGMLQLG